ncbi:MAG: hypothetical protein N7Q72_00450, partial [Spiroplasma sp. Tabriz.8]|nr:hypothetical protein [Candidatus Regiella insecticola]MCX2959382.1 hypothetical protein [Serratia symbiotica]MCZ8631717.1 hypothetical protein [Spiroplasma sp. Tabriz.8]
TKMSVPNFLSATRGCKSIIKSCALKTRVVNVKERKVGFKIIIIIIIIIIINYIFLRTFLYLYFDILIKFL